MQAETIFEAVALARIVVDEDRERARITSKLGLVIGHVVGDAVLGPASREGVHDRWTGVGVAFASMMAFVKMVGVRRSGLRHVDVLEHHADVGQLFAVLFLAVHLPCADILAFWPM